MGQMSEPARKERDTEPEPPQAEGEPHPAELLMKLTGSEGNSSAGRRIHSPPPGPSSPGNAAKIAVGAQADEPPAAGPPLPVPLEPHKPGEVPLEARGLAATPSEPETVTDPGAMQRAMSGLKSALPLIHRLLPLLDGNILAAVSNLLAPHAQPAQKPVDLGPHLAPLQGGLAELKTQQRDLRGQVAEQNSALHRIADQLEQIREATDRNTLEQQELIDELKSAGKRMNIVALVAFALLAVSVALNVFLYFQLQRLLP
jgi:hypothetical protein